MAAKAPKTATGVPRSTLSGSDQLSYRAARMRKTQSSEKPKIAERRDALLRLLLLEAHADVVEPHLGGHGLAEDLFEGLHHLAGAVARLAHGVDLRRAVEVVAHGELRAGARLRRSSAPKAARDRPCSLLHVELAHVSAVGPVLALRLHVDLPLAAEAVEVVDEVAAHERLEGLVDLPEVDALLEHLVPVHVDVKLGHRREERGGRTGRAPASSSPPRETCLTFSARNPMSLPARSSRTKVAPPASPDALNRRGRKGKGDGLGQLGQLPVQVGHDGVVLAPPAFSAPSTP